MRNPLDLNNFPDDFSRDHYGRQTLDDSSSSASGILENGATNESGKVYECRFCSLKFGKSQALGGHMNRHRQERETETLNRARQLVFSNDNLLPQLPHQLGAQHGGFHHPAAGRNMGSTVYPTRLFSGTSSTTMLPPPPPQPQPPPPPHMYTSPSSRLNNPYPSQYPINDYVVGHVFTNNPPPFTIQNISTTTVPPPDSTNNYTCIGAPVGQSFTLAGGSGGNNGYHQDGF